MKYNFTYFTMPLSKEFALVLLCLSCTLFSACAVGPSASHQIDIIWNGFVGRPESHLSSAFTELGVQLEVEYTKTDSGVLKRRWMEYYSPADSTIMTVRYTIKDGAVVNEERQESRLIGTHQSLDQFFFWTGLNFWGRVCVVLSIVIAIAVFLVIWEKFNIYVAIIVMGILGWVFDGVVERIIRDIFS